MILITAVTNALEAGEKGDPQAAFFGFMGLAAALVFANLGAAYGTAKSGVGICSIGVLRPNLIIKSILPVILAGILGIYGLIVAIILLGVMNKNKDQYKYWDGYAHLGSGLCCGLSSLAAGLAIGIVGDVGIRGAAQQSKVFLGMLLILIFAEALGLYGFIVSLIIATR